MPIADVSMDTADSPGRLRRADRASDGSSSSPTDSWTPLSRRPVITSCAATSQLTVALLTQRRGSESRRSASDMTNPGSSITCLNFVLKDFDGHGREGWKESRGVGETRREWAHVSGVSERAREMETFRCVRGERGAEKSWRRRHARRFLEFERQSVELGRLPECKQLTHTPLEKCSS